MERLLKLWEKYSQDYKSKTKQLLKRLKPLLENVPSNRLEQTLDQTSKIELRKFVLNILKMTQSKSAKTL